MKPLTINRFDGGVADVRDISSNSFSSVRHFILGKTKLTPYRAMETETIDSGVLENQRITDVIRYNYSGTTTQIFALGQVSTSNAYPKFYQKSTTNSPTATFSGITSGEDSSGTVIPGSLIGYKGALYCLKTKTGSTYLVKHVYATSTTEVGAIGLSPSNGVVPQMFIHPKDNRLYMGSGYTMGSYDGTTLSTRDFSTAHDITSITHQGNNIAIGMVSKDNNGSVVGLWNGSITSSELVDVVDFGGDTLLVLENINDVVVGVSGLSVGGSSDVGTQNAIIVRGYSGGTAQIIKTIESVGSLGSRVYPLKAKRNGVLYFPMSAYLNGTRVHQIWSLSKNEVGQWVLSPDRKLNNDTELATESIIGLSLVGDYMWGAFSSTSSTGYLYRTNDQATYTTTSIYETLINPSMEIGDRTKKKQLKSISVAKAHNTGNIGQLVLKYSVDGGQNWVTIGTLASAGGNVLKGTNESTGKAFEQAYDYMFRVESTLGAEIVELKYAYEIVQELI